MLQLVDDNGREFWVEVKASTHDGVRIYQQIIWAHSPDQAISKVKFILRDELKAASRIKATAV